MIADLPDPAALMRTWGCAAAAVAAFGGWEEHYQVDADGAEHQQGDGTFARLVLIEGDRAVLFGMEHDSGTLQERPPVDVLDGAPRWVPWPELILWSEQTLLGFLYRYEEGRWSRPDYPVDDLMPETIGHLFSTDQAHRTLCSHGSGTGLSDAHLDVAVGRLLAAAATASVDREMLAALTGRGPGWKKRLTAAEELARTAGTVPGSEVPVSPPWTAEVPARTAPTGTIPSPRRDWDGADRALFDALPARLRRTLDPFGDLT